MRLVRRMTAGICLLMALWFMLPVCIGIVNIGVIYPVVGLLLVAAALWHWERFTGYLLRHKGVRIVLCVTVSVAVAMLAVPLAMMRRAACQTPPADATVIVMGCQVLGDQPSVMLNDRCEAALQYLQEHPTANCVATGGVGDRATITEAEAIYRYLTAHGIQPHRIALEEQATNSKENITFSAQLIRQKGWNKQVAVVSDSFHQWRSGYFAEQSGLTAAAVNSYTRPTMAPMYWAREIVAVYKALILNS